MRTPERNELSPIVERRRHAGNSRPRPPKGQTSNSFAVQAISTESSMGRVGGDRRRPPRHPPIPCESVPMARSGPAPGDRPGGPARHHEAAQSCARSGNGPRPPACTPSKARPTLPSRREGLWIFDPSDLRFSSALRPTADGREAELLLVGGATLRVTLNISSELRMSDYFESDPSFVPGILGIREA